MAAQPAQRVVVTGTGIICALGIATACRVLECVARWALGNCAYSGDGCARASFSKWSRGSRIPRGRSFRAVTLRSDGSLCTICGGGGTAGGERSRLRSIRAKPLRVRPLFGKSGERVAVITGTSMGGQTSLDRGFAAIYKEGRPRPHPFTIPLTMYNAGASQIAMDSGDHRASVHHLHRLRLCNARHRPGILDGALRDRRGRDLRRK